MAKYGLLLVNLGTPNSPKVADVRKYLAQFLSDPRVIDIPAVLRYLLLAIILISRPKKSAKAYSKIWLSEGSPLLVHAKNIVSGLEEKLPKENWVIELGMRYANPSIDSAIKKLLSARVTKIKVMPLFPQYASSSYGSAIAEVYRCLTKHDYVIPVEVIEPYYSNPDYIEALYKVTTNNASKFDYLLMSFHGLPERHVIRSDGGKLPKGCDLRGHCPKISKDNFSCYRAQCYETARLLAEKMALKEYGVSFQSRLGNTPWIQPYTEDCLEEILEKGYKSLAVVCPSFVTDCLETIEEIGIELKNKWLEMGGKEFQLVPCLNSDEVWLEAICSWIKKGL